MKDRPMPTVTHEARVEDLPQAWRKDFDAGSRVRVTIRSSTTDAARREAEYLRRKAAVGAAAGLWSDRSDDELEAHFGALREADRERLDKIIPQE